jgi:hypothetical protein
MSGEWSKSARLGTAHESGTWTATTHHLRARGTLLRISIMIPNFLLLAIVFFSGSQPLQRGKDNELSAKEIAALKIQRNIADAYMRLATQMALDNLEKAAKNKKTGKEALQKHLGRKRYFDSGTDVKELVEFKRQLKEADEAKIKLTDVALQELIKAAAEHQVDSKGLQKIEQNVMKQYAEATSQTILDALAAEFRARIIRELNAKKKQE